MKKNAITNETKKPATPIAVANWYVYDAILLGRAELMPASVGLSTLKAIASTPVEQYMAAGLIFSMLPVLFYLLMQRYIISGLTAGAVKG